ncbi:hypothetical protein EZV62_003313 [Acer yangbiense]|uniref:PGG domain-containing protein n=1 Tax=Acer yangbiense TaxID=1000413 RepID=A0A5C7IH30_9ROSI|nr:hypothetical protein EZV62_003313 [Acer yangbiense]
MVEAASSTQPDNKEISEMPGEESTVEQSAFSTQSTVVGEQSAVEKKRQQLSDNEGPASSPQPDIQELINEMFEKVDSIQSNVYGEQSSVKKKRQHLAEYEDILKKLSQKVASDCRVDLARYQPLWMAVYDKNMKAVEDFINKNLETILDAHIDESGSTIFHLIVQLPATELTEALTKKLVSKVHANSLVEQTNIFRLTALHTAAGVGNTKAVELLVKKNKDLLTKRSCVGWLPLSFAIVSGRYKDTVEYLLSDPEGRIENFADKFPLDSADVLFQLIRANHIDLAFGFLNQNPKLADRDQNPDWKKTLYLLAGKDTELPTGKLVPSSRVPGAVLQMQLELQWFKTVEDVFHPSIQEQRNSNRKKPREVFTEEHGKLVKEGEKWMKGTATSCSVVAALIITVAFATAYTFPGSINGEGVPNFFPKTSFKVFLVSIALALFSSTASVQMFLGILTSRYAEEDFLESLPKKLIIGLVTLLFSIATMMLAFASTFHIFLHQPWKWVTFLMAILGIIPVTLFALMQFPLLLDIYKFTYGHTFLRPMK